MGTRAIATLALAVGLTVAVGCGSDDDDSEQTGGARSGAAERPLSGTFVGEARTTDGGLVAVVAAAPAGGRARRVVRVYVCSPRDNLYEWFAGSVAGSRLSLSNAEGSSVEGKLSGGQATGTVAVEGGRTLRFTAPAAKGLAGLYRLGVRRDGHFSGASTSGGRIKGEVSRGAITQTITAPNRESRAVRSKRATFTPKGVSSFEGFFIVSDARIVGGTRSGNKSQPFIDQSGDL